MKKIYLLLIVLLSSGSQASLLIFDDEALFLAATQNLSFESFETQQASNIRIASSLSTDGFDMVMNTGPTLGVYSVDYLGMHATDGSNFVAFSDGLNTVNYQFNNPINSFAITLTDYGDFGNGTILFGNDIGQSQTAATSGQSDANEQFFGIISSQSFSQVFLSHQINGEIYGVDSVHYGLSQVQPDSIPEPSTVLLMLISLLALLSKLRPLCNSLLTK